MGLQGEKCASNKTDIWASSLTMMKILAGDVAVKSAIKYVSCVKQKFISYLKCVLIIA